MKKSVIRQNQRFCSTATNEIKELSLLINLSFNFLKYKYNNNIQVIIWKCKEKEKKGTVLKTHHEKSRWEKERAVFFFNLYNLSINNSYPRVWLLTSGSGNS